MTDHDPLIVSRFDVAMEPAPEEEPILTIGCIAEDGRPVALLLDPETRAKVARWLAPSRADVLTEVIEMLADTRRSAAAADGMELAEDLVRRMAGAAEQGESTPHLDDRATRLYDHILGTGGEWTTGRAHRWVVANLAPNASRYRVRLVLQHLAALGYLIEHNQPGRVSYRPNYAKHEAE
ncbi:hypothetical protein [Streptomyces sp. NPDC002994]|uniref:hypothetical protein n=1 Tax=Streptomyces sp. NPDC002994 TaxID=3154441 RepID=UPI0033A608C1